MELKRALRVDRKNRVAFVGAGGKTIAMFSLARQFKTPVLVSCTTHLGTWQLPLADVHIIVHFPSDIPSKNDPRLAGIVLFTGVETSDSRLQGLTTPALEHLATLANELNAPLLIEADGSRQKPIKAPGEHEPVIPEFIDTVVVIAGLSALNKPLTLESVHRPERFSELSGIALGEKITQQAILRLLLHPDGGLKNTPGCEIKRRCIAVLNQADTLELQAQGQVMARQLLGAYESALVSALQITDGMVQARYEKIAAVVLAAGAATRFGKLKQLLEFRGEPFVRAVARQALAAGLEPVLVVTGAHSQEVRQVLHDLPVQIIPNSNWRFGQSTSVKTGLRRVPPDVGGCIFLLADQPQVHVTLLRALAEEHALTGADIIAPLVGGQRTNPVFFDRQTFNDLLRLKGDTGGRAIFSSYRLHYLPWHDLTLLIDVDTPEDYQHLQENR